MVSAGYEVSGVLDNGLWRVGAGLQKSIGDDVSRELSQFGESWSVEAPEHDGIAAFASAGITLRPSANSTLSVEVSHSARDDWDAQTFGVRYGLTW